MALPLAFRPRSGFTLVELTIVVAIIAIVVSAVVVSLDPARRIGSARETRARQEAEQIQKAIELYAVDNHGDWPVNFGEPYNPGQIPPGQDEMIDVCTYPNPDPVGCVSLDALVQAGYLSTIPEIQDDDVTPGTTGFTFAYDDGAPQGVSAPDDLFADSDSGGGASSSSTPPPPATSTYALSFASLVPARVAVPHSESLNFSHTDAFSISLWVKYGYDGNVGPLVYKQDENFNSGPGYGVWLEPTGQVYAIMTDGQPGLYKRIQSHSTATVANSLDIAYTHVAVTYDPTQTEANRFTIYMDGTTDTVNDLAEPITQTTQNTDELYLAYGRIPWWTSNLAGQLDDVRIYNKTLTVQEVADLSNGLDVDNANLISYWKLDEGSGTAAADEKLTNPGTLESGPTWITDVFTGP